MQQNTSKVKPKEVEKILINNQYEALLMEEVGIPPLEMITVEVKEKEAHVTTSIPPMSPRNERSKKADVRL